MKAYVLHGVNDLRYDDVAVPACPKGWAIVKVKASGICSSDIARIFIKGTYHFPTIPGHEFSGIVESVGDVKDRSLIGMHVGVFPLIPCKNCSQCMEKHYEMCSDYDYLGSRRDGGFAEYVAVPTWNLIMLDDDVSFIEAAMLEPLSVAFHAVKLSGVGAGQTIGIIGTGMIGIAAGQWAKKMGANEVTIVGRNEIKRSLVEKCGLKYVVCTDTDSIGQFDIILEAVGSNDAIDLAVWGAKPGGVVILMGNPAGNIQFSQNTYWRILRKQLVLKGIWNSMYDGLNISDWTESAQALATGDIDLSSLASHCFSQNELMEGLNLMREHKEPYCKVMTVWNE